MRIVEQSKLIGRLQDQLKKNTKGSSIQQNQLPVKQILIQPELESSSSKSNERVSASKTKLSLQDAPEFTPSSIKEDLLKMLKLVLDI